MVAVWSSTLQRRLFCSKNELPHTHFLLNLTWLNALNRQRIYILCQRKILPCHLTLGVKFYSGSFLAVLWEAVWLSGQKGVSLLHWHQRILPSLPGACFACRDNAQRVVAPGGPRSPWMAELLLETGFSSCWQIPASFYTFPHRAPSKPMNDVIRLFISLQI